MAEKEADAAVDVEKKVMLVGFSDSAPSLYALQWTIEHFFAGGAAGVALNHKYKLVILYAKPIPSIPGASDDGEKIAGLITAARELCAANSVSDAEFEIGEGDARYVLCDAAERLRADVLVVGSFGYAHIIGAAPDSVSDYCAHHARCTLMIVKKPKLPIFRH